MKSPLITALLTFNSGLSPLNIILDVCFAAALWLCSATALAQTTIVRPDLHTDTKIAPLYFGPNAFPVPEMLDDAIAPTLQVTAAGTEHWGDFGDRATDALLRLRVPLFTPRANLVLWVPIEHYRLTQQWKEHARIGSNPTTSGTAIGTAFVTTDVLLMRETRRRPAMSLRAAIKTASEDSWQDARYYDCPGYFFDAAFGKGITFDGSWLQSLRLGASAGFLCWQTDNGRQNDATMYGVELKAKFRYVELSQDLRGYCGWEGDGDRPMVMKSQIAGHFPFRRAPKYPTGNQNERSKPTFSPFLCYEKGLRDYPYQSFSAGITIDFDISRKQRDK